MKATRMIFQFQLYLKQYILGMGPSWLEFVKQLKVSSSFNMAAEGEVMRVAPATMMDRSLTRSQTSCRTIYNLGYDL